MWSYIKPIKLLYRNTKQQSIKGSSLNERINFKPKYYMNSHNRRKVNNPIKKKIQPDDLH